VNVIVFGANGRLGAKTVAQLLRDGHTVRAYVHNRSTLPSDPRLEVWRGDVHDMADVADAMAGMDAVVSTLGSAGAAVPDVASAGARAIVAAAGKSGVRRIVSVTGSAVYNDRETPHPYTIARNEAMQVSTPHLLEDGEESLRVYQAADDLPWTVLRVPMMDLHHDKTGFALSDTPPHPRHTVSYEAAANAIAHLVASPDWLHAAPFLR
jgi:putative NADH-flavin reductase